MKHWFSTFAISFCLAGLSFVGCGGGDGTYARCDAADQCAVEDDEVAACLGEGSDGFCAIECNSDADCDDDDYVWVCSPFESEPAEYCFPSCEGDNVCPPDYECRSTGGGSANRKICFPNFL